MSIRLRFTVALTLLGVVLFGTYAIIDYRSEVADLRTATLREIRLIGRSLETALGNALRDRQRADIDETLTTLEALEPEVDIHVHEPDGRPIAHSRGAATDEAVERLVERAAMTRTELVVYQPESDPTRLVFAAPLLGDDGTLLGAMAIARPTDDLEADLARTRARMIALVAVFVVAMMLGGLGIGTLNVTKPLVRLLAGVRQAREGDFRTPVESVRKDEIGTLVAEFNAMLAALGDARRRTEAETELRARLEDGLQRADKLITIGQLSAGLAHEIGSPLQVMSGRASTLLDHSDPEVRRQAQQLVAQCDRITKVVEQLLAFGRRRPAALGPCNLVEPVRSVIDLLGGEARRHGITLVMETDERPHRIDADPDQLQQVTLNLVKNALAATPAGGTITVRIVEEADMVRLIVRDTGAGIPPEHQEKLFEPFFTTRAQQGGTGLGLAVVRAIATEHGATVAVTSDLGKGAEFVVGFKAKEAARA